MQSWGWRRSWFHVAALWVLAALPALAQQAGDDPIDGVYRGTLGKEEIILEVGATVPRSAGLASSYFSGRYFYPRYGIPISLIGEPMSDGRIRLREYGHTEPTGAQLRLEFQDGKATGVFCRCTDEAVEPIQGELKITLMRVSKGLHPGWDPANNPPDRAYYNLLLDFPLQTGPEIRVNKKIAYEVQSDPRFEIGMPRLTRFPDATVMLKVNEDLAQELDKERIWISDCQEGQEQSGYEEKIHVTPLNTRVLRVVKEKLFYYCGGAHPDHETDMWTYDMKTGKRY